MRLRLLRTGDLWLKFHKFFSRDGDVAAKQSLKSDPLVRCVEKPVVKSAEAMLGLGR
jgi:hypothetical protein